jgi:hypothetical protein
MSPISILPNVLEAMLKVKELKSDKLKLINWLVMYE